MSTVPQQWDRALQWRSCSYKQLSCHQLKLLKTGYLEKAFSLGTAKGTKTNIQKTHWIYQILTDQ